jgi:hypothetical protein
MVDRKHASADRLEAQRGVVGRPDFRAAMGEREKRVLER